MALPASSSGLFRFVSQRSRLQSTDIVAAASWGVFAGTAGLYLVQGLVVADRIRDARVVGSTDIVAAASWGVFAGTAGLYLVQPFGWIKKTFFEKPEPEA